jgi:hypothetical protein
MANNAFNPFARQMPGSLFSQLFPQFGPQPSATGTLEPNPTPAPRTLNVTGQVAKMPGGVGSGPGQHHTPESLAALNGTAPAAPPPTTPQRAVAPRTGASNPQNFDLGGLFSQFLNPMGQQGIGMSQIFSPQFGQQLRQQAGAQRENDIRGIMGNYRNALSRLRNRQSGQARNAFTQRQNQMQDQLRRMQMMFGNRNQGNGLGGFMNSMFGLPGMFAGVPRAFSGHPNAF